MTEESIVWRADDLTPRLCRRCHSVVRGPVRRVSEGGHVQYECIDACTEREWIESSTGEPQVQDHFREHADAEVAAMRRDSDE